MHRSGLTVFFSALFLLITCCSKDNIEAYCYSIPDIAADGWTVTDAANKGLRTDVLVDMMDRINTTAGHNIHSILIFKDSSLVFEEYFEGYLYLNNPPGSNGDYVLYDRDEDHFLASVSKTVTSAIFGCAVREGFITDLEEKIIDLFPGYTDILTGEKADITVKHLLTMTAGLSWDESSYPYTDPRNDVTMLFRSDDPLESILDNPLMSSPGSEFLYNSGATNILGAIIEEKTGMTLLDFGNQYLFDPLNVSGGAWERISSELFFASGGVYLRPRELAKIGSVYLNDGYWGDHQCITTDWIEASVNRHIATQGRTLPWATHYGYQWWIKEFFAGGQSHSCFLAAGWGDQYMFVFPDLDMIIVFNGGNYFSSGSLNHLKLVEDYILEALN